MARYKCVRCGADENTLNVPHLCKDLKKRYERQAEAVEIVMNILKDNFEGEWEAYPNSYYEDVAVAIIKKIGSRHLD